ncbi:hypothetical protein K469DRAFT_196669 [Zopfia rhizophila CBS 207.26]|uniref:Uncharacterized protein n=1 Tax=Zopfia rhizophila CBS 207.26 TaxID=1314779 RepID=A0A6A6EUA5_9PEZI|nr:hypothetical protein K469DRAFT_196669 [Zopfia rhizophila CBS 207.26]
MPLGRPRVVLSPQSPTADPRTAVFHSDPTTRPPPYKPTPRPPKPRSRDASSDRDLNYFHAFASGEYVVGEPFVPQATLALHLFSGTDTHTFPIAERLTLGPATGAPYYAVRATPNTLSALEYNTLIVSRRHPLRLVSEDVCVADIQPRLNLFAQGIHKIGKILRVARSAKSRNDEEYVVTWSNGTMGPLDGSWCLWQGARAVAHFYEERGFRGLDEDPGKDIIRAKSPPDLNIRGIGPPDFTNPRTTVEDLAYLDFETQVPLFVSSNPQAHALMDVIVAALFMLLTVTTRKAAVIRQQEEAAWQHGGPPPSYTG